jgi:hypothetical protein
MVPIFLLYLDEEPGIDHYTGFPTISHQERALSPDNWFDNSSLCPFGEFRITGNIQNISGYIQLLNGKIKR